MGIETKTIRIPVSTEERGEIRAFVVDFYRDIQKHDILGPIFNDKIGDHWDQHFETLTDFWVTVLLGKPVYKGNPFLAHRTTPGIQNTHFDTWLDIFEISARKMLSPNLAETAISKAGRIADSLRQGLFFKPTG